MAGNSERISVELLRIKQSIFALIFTDQSDNQEKVQEIINSLPQCSFDKNRLIKITNLYHEIKEDLSFSLEDVYTVLSIDNDNAPPILSAYKRQCMKEYRQHIIDVIERTKEQVALNVGKVDMCKIAHTIFHRSQEYSDERPKFIANLWFLGNAQEENNKMKQAFERYALASLDKRQNQQFCADRIIQLLAAYQKSVSNSFRIHYLDHVIDQIYAWYFIEPEKCFDFLIFNPDIFEDIQNFMLSILDQNPFCFYLRKAGEVYERIDATETCLDSDNMLYMNDANFNDITCLRQLHKLYNIYHKAHTAYGLYGMYNCKCHDLTRLVSSTFGKDPNKRIVDYSSIQNLLSEDNFVSEYDHIIHDRPDFILQTVKPYITKTYIPQCSGIQFPLF